jgi:kynureninase
MDPDGTVSEQAAARDARDPLASFRDEFVITDRGLIYLDGNSLGRLPKRARADVVAALDDEWGDSLIQSWDRWLDLGTRTGDVLAPLIGARSGEVVLADQTTVNLYKLASAAMAASGRTDVVTDEGNFPSDLYVLDSVARAAGGRLRVLPADPDPRTVGGALDESVGLVSMSLVAFRSGAILDQRAINEAAHAAGALTLWDLSHAAGAIPVGLAENGSDLAIGCTYKYLNGGPGAPAFLYVREDLQHTLTQPITGWWGHEEMFAFAADYAPASDIRRFLVGTPPVLSLVSASAGIEVTARAGIAAIRDKSSELSRWFIELADRSLAEHGFEVITPRDPERRGSHVALRHPRAWQVSRALRARGVIPDFRTPDVVRFGLAPLYNSFTQVFDAIETTAEIVASGYHLEFPTARGGVT